MTDIVPCNVDNYLRVVFFSELQVASTEAEAQDQTVRIHMVPKNPHGDPGETLQSTYCQVLLLLLLFSLTPPNKLLSLFTLLGEKCWCRFSISPLLQLHLFYIPPPSPRLNE